MLEATEIRNIAGFLTIEEAAERYGIDVERITGAVLAEEVGSMTLEYEDDVDLVILRTKNGAVAEWLEANR